MKRKSPPPVAQKRRTRCGTDWFLVPSATADGVGGLPSEFFQVRDRGHPEHPTGGSGTPAARAGPADTPVCGSGQGAQNPPAGARAHGGKDRRPAQRFHAHSRPVRDQARSRGSQATGRRNGRGARTEEEAKRGGLDPGGESCGASRLARFFNCGVRFFFHSKDTKAISIELLQKDPDRVYTLVYLYLKVRLFVCPLYIWFDLDHLFLTYVIHFLGNVQRLLKEWELELRSQPEPHAPCRRSSQKQPREAGGGNAETVGRIHQTFFSIVEAEGNGTDPTLRFFLDA
ncbi:MAG: hypothetical protein BJ554DRAFT_4352 [Olpidium bornovanus]|uniref:Uncharacterized protein n=1 Tax=Olpidium bornovanus TaxID=278681 RepID=A0A8H8DF50_9FUNG|nr:MAG: hypothetical protein BJ554DRAFT_4352 [Olpidium bornovanus]